MSTSGASARRDRLRALRRFDRRLQRASVTGSLPTLRWWKRRFQRPLRVVVAAWRDVRAFGDEVSRVTGMSRTRQLADTIVVGIRWGTPAYVWYRLALFRPDRRAEAEWFLHHAEHDRLLASLADGERQRWQVMDDKRTFERWASSHGLPANAPLATAADGQLTDRPTDLAEGDLVVKSAGGGGGRGLEFLLAVQGAPRPQWRTSDGGVLDAAGVLDHLAEVSADGPHVLERRLAPHPALADLAVGLCTVRVVTARVGDDHPTIIATVLGVPAAPDEVDNFTAGGLAAPVDAATGQLLAGSTIHADRATISHAVHPVTGAVIAGRRLPDWHDVLDLARTAHTAAAGVTTVGWDVALTDRGPILLEANMKWNGEMPQVPGAPPLARTAWLEILTESLGVPE